MSSLHIHEVHKIVDDLTHRQQYELAFALCDLYRHAFDDGYLHHQYLVLAWRMGDFAKTVALMEEALQTNRWISTWFIQQFGVFRDLMDKPAFQAVYAEIQAREQAYWQTPLAEPILQRPETADGERKPLLIALHGNGLNAGHSAENWSAATKQGWIVTHPVAPNIIGYHQHWWDEMAQSKQIVETNVESVYTQERIDKERIVLAGFSSGGQVALQMALEGSVGACGFLLVGAGGEYFSKDESYWRPLIANAPAGLRGVMWYSDYDMERSGEDVNRLLRLFEEYSLAVRFVKIDLAGHGFPTDFDQQLRDALAFVVAN